MTCCATISVILLNSLFPSTRPWYINTQPPLNIFFILRQSQNKNKDNFEIQKNTNFNQNTQAIRAVIKLTLTTVIYNWIKFHSLFLVIKCLISITPIQKGMLWGGIKLQCKESGKTGRKLLLWKKYSKESISQQFYRKESWRYLKLFPNHWSNVIYLHKPDSHKMEYMRVDPSQQTDSLKLYVEEHSIHSINWDKNKKTNRSTTLRLYHYLWLSNKAINSLKPKLKRNTSLHAQKWPFWNRLL